MADEIKIRLGTLADLDAMMEIAMMATAENSFAEADPELLLREIYPALMLQQGLVGIIGEPGKQIEAAVLIRLGNIWYSRTMLLEEKAIFVHPDFRAAKGGRAARLCEFSKHVSDELGLPLTIGVLSNERTEAKVRMYSRIMGKPAGAYWLYNVQTGGHTPAQVEAA